MAKKVVTLDGKYFEKRVSALTKKYTKDIEVEAKKAGIIVEVAVRIIEKRQELNTKGG